MEVKEQKKVARLLRGLRSELAMRPLSWLVLPVCSLDRATLK